MLEIKNIGFGYPGGNKLFHNINIIANTGQIIGLYGPSGVGKTTLLKIIGGLLKPLEGDVIYNDSKIFSLKYKELANYRNQQIGFIFQNFNLLDDFKVEENIMLPYTISITKTFDFDLDWFEYLIDFFEIKKLIGKNVNNISGGEKQRVSIVKAFIHKPKIVLMDEPTTYLNFELSKKFFELVENYSKENICIFVSHDEYLKQFFKLNQIAHYSDILVYSNK